MHYIKTIKYNTMRLIIETTNIYQAGDIENSFNIAMETTNIESFISSLNEELPAYEIIEVGSHIAIHRDNTRVAMIIKSFL